ncbi:MAG: MmcQ/YjbR family DNA-binding protein [Gemmatimonadota bacterium]|nr:MmcQ/YjbR family DNA-binding protein [Gemmatimonadota bacterium]MDH3423466.1 MmcQ/YjbR family DNA-binding protein [Gemmatimonadota bacterium]
MPTNQDQVRGFALSLPGVEESSHRGRPDLRVGGKIFATLPTESAAVNLKIAPENLEHLVARDPATFSSVWGQHWLGVALERISFDQICLLLEDAWRLTAPKRLLRELDART